jgi:replicative DNA helicase
MKAAATVLPKPPARDEDGFELPRSLEAEKSTLGAALLRSAAADYIVDKLTVDSYFRRAHREIFKAIVALRERQVEVDLLTIRAELQRVKQLDEVGGSAYISALTDGVPRTSNVAHYADILKDLQAKRAIADFANRTLDLVAAGEHSAHALLGDADRRLMDLQAGHIAGRMLSLKESQRELMDDLEWRVKHKGELTGVETGFKSINELTSGWQPGDLVIIAARPSIGKTTFLMNSLVAAALSGRRVAVFSFEMRRKQLEYRMLASLTGVALTRILGGYLTDSEWAKLSAAIVTMADLPLHVDDKAGQPWGDIRGTCRRLKADGGLDIVGIDYAQLIPGSLERRGASRNDEVTDISRGLKTLADELGVPILLLSQLTRDNEKRSDQRPKLSDLRESGSLEQDADIVGFIHRRNHREGGVSNFILEKQRNGPTGTVNITLDRDIVTFTDGGDEPPPAPPPETAKPHKPKHRPTKQRSFTGDREDS